jgi:ABC-type multidrug transport system fused ATPase/permease subunit
LDADRAPQLKASVRLLHLALNMTKQSRPVSIVITQIVMLISLVPLALGFTFALLRTLLSNPNNLLSVRALGFFVLSFGLLAMFLIYGFGGLWKRKRYGYWLGLIFLAAINAKNIYVYAPNMYNLIVRGSNESSSLLLGNKSQAILIIDVAVQSVMFVLLLVLFLRVLFGKKERMFFHSASNVERA